MVRGISLLGVGLLLAACGNAGTTTAPTTGPIASTPAATTPAGSAAAGAITATESEFKIEMSPTTAAPGPVTFQITNSGTQVHEFVVVKTDVAADALPQKTDEPEVDEDASSLTAVDEVEDIAAGASASLDVTLEAGHYVLFCNVPGHYQLGMHTDFTVGP
jgi:uncharacterized cupredoxin-like copper-binding protein